MNLLAQIEGIKGFSVPALDLVTEDEVTTLPIEYDEPLSNEHQKAAGFKSSVETSGNPSNTDSLTAKVAWTAGQNKLVDDADKEFTNLQRVAQPEPFGIDVSLQPTTGKGSRALAEFLNVSTARKFENTNPSHVFGSFSEFARSIVKSNEEEWPGVVQAWKEKRNDPDAFAVNITKHKKAFRKLMEHAVFRIDLAIGTPVALAEFAHHRPQHEPQLPPREAIISRYRYY
ncbi:AAA domain-containing [Fusarium acutatum]|uniref:AAA domain-containing n=1 Tax=Fusarium acutatum TaxID=78861 RepID=A0A8H4NQ26_9HYPO|nr:AAA domain-containing [Fusarium acutatum]